MTTCSNDPDSQHGFDRQASHNEGRHVCECEGQMEQVSNTVMSTVDEINGLIAQGWKQGYAAGKRKTCLFGELVEAGVSVSDVAIVMQQGTATIATTTEALDVLNASSLKRKKCSEH